MDEKLAERLQELRKANGLSQEELADKLNVSRQAVSKWECGTARPDTENLIALSELYNCTIDDMLFGGTDFKSGIDLDDEDDDDDDEKPTFIGIASAVTVFASAIAFVLIGALLGKWHPAWIVFFFIPIVPTLIESIYKRDGRIFCFPILVTAVYLYMGCRWGLWHPWWVLFFLIPIYYALFSIKRK